MKATLCSVVLALGMVVALAGCNAKCGDSCSSDKDCGGDDLVCYASQCAPKECDEKCHSVGVNVCLFNRLSCEYMGCDN